MAYDDEVETLDRVREKKEEREGAGEERTRDGRSNGTGGFRG